MSATDEANEMILASAPFCNCRTLGRLFLHLRDKDNGARISIVPGVPSQRSAAKMAVEVSGLYALFCVPVNTARFSLVPCRTTSWKTCNIMRLSSRTRT